MTPRGFRPARRLVAAALLFGSLLSGAGCAAVSATRREHVVDPIMSFQTDAKDAARRNHAMEAREGSTGGTGGAGGGCACN